MVVTSVEAQGLRGGSRRHPHRDRRRSNGWGQLPRCTFRVRLKEWRWLVPRPMDVVMPFSRCGGGDVPSVYVDCVLPAHVSVRGLGKYDKLPASSPKAVTAAREQTLPRNTHTCDVAHDRVNQQHDQEGRSGQAFRGCCRYHCRDICLPIPGAEGAARGVQRQGGQGREVAKAVVGDTGGRQGAAARQ